MKKIILIAGLLSAAISSKAQIANADISIEITSPANNVTIPAGDSLFVSFDFYNNGPDTLAAGDSLFFYCSGIILYSQLTQPLAVGAGIAMDNVLYLYNPTDSTLSGDVCVLHLKQSDVNYQNGGHPNTTYSDTVPSNDTSCVMVTLLSGTTGIANIKTVKNQFEIYPNPASNQVSINGITRNEDIEISIVNTLGQEVWKGEISKGMDKVHVDISQFANGIYIVRQTNKGDTQSARFTVQH